MAVAEAVAQKGAADQEVEEVLQRVVGVVDVRRVEEVLEEEEADIACLALREAAGHLLVTVARQQQQQVLLEAVPKSPLEVPRLREVLPIELPNEKALRNHQLSKELMPTEPTKFHLRRSGWN